MKPRQQGLGMGEQPGQGDLLAEYQAQSFEVQARHVGPCAFCGQPSIGDCVHEGRTVRVCEEHHRGAWTMVNT